MTPPTPLTNSQLARYIGKRVEYEQRDMDGIFQAHTDTLTLTGLLDAEMFRANGEASFIRNIRPVLRRLSSITEEEAVKCFQLAFLAFGASWVPDQVQIAAEQILVYNSACELHIEATEGKAWVRGKSDRDGFGLATFFNAVAVVDFLDEIGIDQRGYIEKGLAVEKTEV